MVDAETLYPLLHEHRIYLCSDRADGHFLAESFIRTWAEIPGHHRDSMIQHWTQKQDQLNPQPLRIVHLADEWGASSDPRAQVRENGHKIYFQRSWCGEAPAAVPEVLMPLIAHELAHVALLAGGEPNHVENLRNDQPVVSPSELVVNQNCERLANDLMESWGFVPLDAGDRARRQGLENTTRPANPGWDATG
jgi:hypothetical protein